MSRGDERSDQRKNRVIEKLRSFPTREERKKERKEIQFQFYVGEVVSKEAINQSRLQCTKSKKLSLTIQSDEMIFFGPK